jgi:hypothetical protein
MLTQAYKKELRKFDTQRVRVVWDALISKQQAALESLGVPVMYVSHLTSDTEASRPSILADFVTIPNITFMIAVRDGP